MSTEERKLSVDGHVYRYGLVNGTRCWYTGYSCKVAVDDETERLLAALSTAERERGNVTLSADEEQRVGLESLLRDLDFHARHGEWLPSRTTSDYYAGLIRKALARVPSGGEEGR